MPIQQISAYNAARDRNSPIKAHQINLQRSLIGSEYQPISRSRSAVLGVPGALILGPRL
jgi:hypothetical protein